MSNFANSLNYSNSNKRTTDSKYLNSFLPSLNDGKQLAKKQKLESLEAARPSSGLSNNGKHNHIKNCKTVNCTQNEANQVGDNNIWEHFFNKSNRIGPSSDFLKASADMSKKTSNKPKPKEEGYQITSSTYLLDSEEESWFEGNLGAVVEKCTQVEAEVGIQVISQVEVQDNSKIQVNNVITNSESNSKLLPTKQDLNLQPLHRTPYNNQRLNKVPLRRTSSGTDWPTAYKNSVQQNCSAFNFKTNANDTERSSLETSENEIERLNNELKVLKEKYQTKEGEVGVLRSKLESTKTDLLKQKQEGIKATEILKSEMNKKLKCYEKEVHTLKSQLQFNKMDIVVAQSQLLLHPPELPKFHAKTSGYIPDRSSLSPKNVSSSKETVIPEKEVVLIQGDLVEACGDMQACQLLLELIVPVLFYKSKPETTAFDPPLFNSNPFLKSKNGSTNKEQENSRSNFNGTVKYGQDIISLQTTCLTLESCYQPLMTLTKMVDLSNQQAKEVLLKILIESMKILEELLLRLRSSTLREHLIEREKEIYESWQTFVPLNKNYNLLHFRPWYDGEKGVEARRCLGLLAILVQLSRFVFILILPTCDSSIIGQGKFDLYDDESQNIQIDKVRSIFYTVRDVVEEIGKQRRTLSLEGVLTGAIQLIMCLIKNEIELPKDSQQVVLDILKGVIFARPGSTVLLSIVELLANAVRYPFITTQLCCKTDQNNCIEDYWEITFTFDTCIVQMLCIMIRQLPEDYRCHRLIDAFVSWICSLFVMYQDEPSWLYFPPDSMSCQCRSLVSQLTVTLLYEVCRKYARGGVKDKKILRKLLSTGVFLVQNLVYQDEHFPINVGEYRGNLVLFLDAMEHLKTEIELHPCTCKILEKLTKEEWLREFSTTIQSDELSGLLSTIDISLEL